ncbi:MAG: co-chaperone DjlA [Alphaproteobacteria bacterium]|nr:co-chaperone DjlA [Alphaproteobacteria bacterium]
MEIKGKLVGGVLGFLVGRLAGAVVGVMLGHFYDRQREMMREFVQQARESEVHIGHTMDQVAFSIGVITLGAKMAKVDGAVTRDEIDAFKRVFRIPPEQEAQVGRLFDRARRDAGGYEPYARQLAWLFRRRPAVLEELLGGLVLIAAADGAISAAERAFLEHLGQIFGFSEHDFARIMAVSGARFAEGGEGAGRSGGRAAGGAPNAYAVLGVDPSADDGTVKAAWRKLIREHHPDKLIADGMPEDFIKVANEKMQRINAAYDTICRERGIK